ncbi:metallophosphatase family protein [Bacteroidales bacterium OttesenSCG-928-E04]|nr:metallophosphatase family protein [Bacteroidales bacterium OttesenSCG-928-E04]
MKKIGVISDTHGWLHPKVFDFFKDCDEIWHAGDICSSNILVDLNAIAPLRAVYGNCDDWGIRAETSEFLVFNCEGHKVALMHIVGTPANYSPKAQEIIKTEKPTIFVAGHSHILKVKQDPKHNLLYINPGGGGISGIHQNVTFLRFNINGKQLSNLEVFDQPKNTIHV